MTDEPLWFPGLAFPPGDRGYTLEEAIAAVGPGWALLEGALLLFGTVLRDGNVLAAWLATVPVGAWERDVGAVALGLLGFDAADPSVSWQARALAMILREGPAACAGLRHPTEAALAAVRPLMLAAARVERGFLLSAVE